jgi:glycosyltransferase involved in cell wall biosynthesis
MLSVCIGIYNYDVNQLVKDLCKQADKLGIEYEVLLLDDASKHDFIMKNAKLDFLPHVTYMQNYRNVGRSVIRNTLASKAKYPYLLFMDCDTKVSHPDYLKKYVEAAPTARVISGGYEYKDRKPKKNYVLRWAYGRQREMVPAEIRNQHPNMSFSTFNFLIEKEIFKTIEFDETLSGYGHEDTLFGLELQNHGIIVRHIDNPLRHEVVATNDKFLKQTENAIDNLFVVYEKVKNKQFFVDGNKLLHTLQKLQRKKMVKLYLRFYSLFKSLIIRNLKSKNPKMRCFDLYKLNYVCQKFSDKKI